MNDDLSVDQFDALAQIAEARPGRPSACVARNTKQLIGLKYAVFAKNGSLGLTEKGQQILFIKNCIDGLRALVADPHTAIARDVATFLGKKGHIAATAEAGGFAITQKGRECLADIDARA